RNLMSQPHPDVAAIRTAVRDWLNSYGDYNANVWVAISGGADSMSLLAALLFHGRAGALQVHAVTVDHQLQEGSTERAQQLTERALSMNCATAQVAPVTVAGSSNIESEARTARYAALDDHCGGATYLLGHTLDDQAESVLMGLGRGSGPKSIMGMAPLDGERGRPLLGIRRGQTRAACLAQGIAVWDDPHNDDPRFTRVRMRNEVLPLLEEILGGGVVAALGRTATMLQQDEVALALNADQLRAALMQISTNDGLDGPILAQFPRGMRTRLIKLWLERNHCRSNLTSAHLTAVEALIMHYHGQGPVYLPGGATIERVRETILLTRK
ncbi:MAG: tRNA lysidine(34) synthetase TilS, partial [Antricoccus sp.]